MLICLLLNIENKNKNQKKKKKSSRNQFIKKEKIKRSSKWYIQEEGYIYRNIILSFDDLTFLEKKLASFGIAMNINGGKKNYFKLK